MKIVTCTAKFSGYDKTKRKYKQNSNTAKLAGW